MEISSQFKKKKKTLGKLGYLQTLHHWFFFFLLFLWWWWGGVGV